ncbi:MAG: hypothetical protein AAF635_06010 [Cyanobacteria bacterium P01_C01_bin.69]
MSLSPFRQDNRPLNTPSPLPASHANEPLTLSQALIITAGLAGLIGLLSGGFMRFSLSRSPNARFLSPLQTFPTVSDQSENAPTEASDFSSTRSLEDNIEKESLGSWEGDSDLSWETGSDFDEFSSEGFTQSPSSTELNEESLDSWGQPLESESGAIGESTAPRNFDSFADRVEGRGRAASDPLKSLSEGPLLRRPERTLPAQNEIYTDNESFENESFSDESFEYKDLSEE